MASAIKKPSPKQVVYLVGAGATQAEVSYRGARPINLLMRDSPELGEGVSTGMLRALNNPKIESAYAGCDAEKLISLFASYGSRRLNRLAEKMRELYFREIKTRLTNARILTDPLLATALLEMHASAEFRAVEALSGVLSTNHDGLFQVASQAVYKGVDLGFQFESSDFAAVSNSIPPVLQLHGSFTWKFGSPISVAVLREDSRYSGDTIWLPPSISKESKSYPFNKISAAAYEILSRKCDVLRVIGASLTQNDWNILALVFHAQKNRELRGGSAFQIELIMSQRTGTRLMTECSYLKNIRPIGQLTDGSFDRYLDLDDSHSVDLKNAFAFWLSEKIKHHKAKGDFGSIAPGDSMLQVLGEAA